MNELQAGCVVCGPKIERNHHTVTEAMFGLDESFDYAECPNCGSLQIVDPPADLSPFYGNDVYYSFRLGRLKASRWLRTPPLSQALRLNRVLYEAFGLGKGMAWLRIADIGVRDRVLDLGCGAGGDLLNLHLLGYRNLTGADPFIDHDTVLPGGVPIKRSFHGEIQGTFDWILMNHSFEHVPDPRATLASAHRLLDGRGRLMVRMPVMGTYAWRAYGAAWVQIDAPRHLALFTSDGFRQLAEESGFRVERIVFDSNEFQFWASEMALKGEPHSLGPVGRFSPRQMREWVREAKRLNTALDGDQAVYILQAT